MSARSLSLAALTLVVVGCSSILGSKDPHEPGTGIGVYSLSLTADSTSTCAELIGANPTATFTATMRKDGTTGYFLAGSEPIAGTLDAAGNFTFTTSIPTQVHDVEKAKGIGACTIVRTDVFAGKFAGAPDVATGNGSLSGTMTYSYAVQSGSDCRDVVGQVSADNPTPIFAVMPCVAKYTVTGTRTGDAAK